MKKKKRTRRPCEQKVFDIVADQIGEEIKDLLLDPKLVQDLTKQFKANETYKKKTKNANFGEY